jgi:hypothetical protein
MNISQQVGIENAHLTYSRNSVVNQGFPEKVGEDQPVNLPDESQNATPDPEAPLPKLGRYINVWLDRPAGLDIARIMPR